MTAEGIGHAGPLWQDRFYDHILRDDEPANGVAEYIIGNPVRKGLVEQPEHYPYSGMPDPL